MNGGRIAGAIVGGLVGGLGITALLIAGEHRSGQASELVTLQRAAARRLALRAPSGDQLPRPAEQAMAQGGHLLLSAAAAAVYAAATDEDSGVLPSGIAFGLAFYAAMHWVAGPALGVKRPEWEADAATIGMHALNHIAFGRATATGARLVER